MPVNGPSLDRRIRAAMALAGLDGFEALADQIDERGYGATKLRKMTGSRPRRELEPIAEACGLPVEFFTVDFDRLRELPALVKVSHHAPSLEERVAALESGLRRLAGEAAMPPGSAPEDDASVLPTAEPAVPQPRRTGNQVAAGGR